MNETIRPILYGTVSPGVYRLTSRVRPTTLAPAAEAAGWRFSCLDGKQIASKRELLAACAGALSFPPHFGYNWDALADSLRDLSWAPAASGYLLLYDAAGRYAAAHPAEFGTLLDIFHDAVASWRETRTPLAVLIRGAGRAARDLPKL